ncbi:hypothetical protein AN958_01919 [Leucoagaricus sp. SymC.cos]|nr:hypothetical protein AN958_01919 [Leucoagaricus sp. SymC.cos]
MRVRRLSLKLLGLYAKEHVNGEVEVWKDELDKLFLFATFFAGVVGAFALDSYHSVKQDPAERTVLLLRSILALQLNATNPQPNLPPGLDPSLIPITAADPHVPISASDKRINIYNFLSLILSLSVVMAGILCLQWLREYNQDPSGIPGPRREHLGIRYMRREGMKKWGVFKILKTLPLILLLALLFFFTSIIELLLQVDKAATIVASVAIGITSFFMWITTLLPTVQGLVVEFFPNLRFPECPYKSPQTWIFLRLFTPSICYLARAIFKQIKPLLPPIHHLVLAISEQIKSLLSLIRRLTQAISKQLVEPLVPPIRHLTRAISERIKPLAPQGDTNDSHDAPTGSSLHLQNWSSYDWLVYSHHTQQSPGGIYTPVFGLHWIGRMYLQEKQLAEALFQCIRTQDETMHASLRDVLAEKGDMHRKKSVDEAWKWCAKKIQSVEDKTHGLSEEDARGFKEAEAHKSDVVVFQTSAHLAEKN